MHCCGGHCPFRCPFKGWGEALFILFGFQWVGGRTSLIFSQWHWGVDEQQWVEVTELEAEEDFRISPCCIVMWEIVGFFYLC